MKKIINIEIKYLDVNEGENQFIRHNNVKGCFRASELGVYAGASHSHYRRSNEYEILENINDEKYDKDYFINSVSTLYRLPNLTLSRDKLANFKDECGFNVIRDKDKADIAVIGENTLNKMTESTYKDVFDYNVWKSAVLNLLSLSSIDQDDKNIIIDFINSIADTFGENIYVGLNTYSYYWAEDASNDREKSINSFLQKIVQKTDLGCKSAVEASYTTYIKADSYDLYTWIYNNQDKLVKDTVLNKLCVQDSVTLGITEFEQLDNLVSSQDEENVNIGLTMMANCNVEDSKLYLALLFANHSENMKGRKVWNHVNFKYLRKIFDNYINLTLSNWGQAYNNLLEYLIKDDCLTMWGSRYISNMMFKNVIESHLGVGTKDCVFTITADDLKLKSKYEDQLVDENDNKLSEVLTEVAGVGHDDLPF